jgi:hypothetical protein
LGNASLLSTHTIGGTYFFMWVQQCIDFGVFGQLIVPEQHLRRMSTTVVCWKFTFLLQ